MTEWWRNIEARPIAYDLGPAPIIDKGQPEEGANISDHACNWRVSLRRGAHGWMIFDAGLCLNKSGEWVHFMPEELYTIDEWIEQHRWQDPEEAIAFYKAWLVEFMEKEGKGDGDD